MTMHCRRAIVALLFCFVAVTASAQEKGRTSGIPVPVTPSHEAVARRLLDVIGGNKIGEQMWSQLFGTLKRQNAAIPDAVWEEINKEVSADFSSGKFGDLIVPIYTAHFTEAEIRQIIVFYESPVGQKMVDALPQIATESMEVGQKRGAEIFKRIEESLRKKGYTLTGG